jgi:hypothetical protein
MTTSQAQKLATVGQVILGGVILALQVAGLIRSRSVKTDVGPAASS